MFLERQARYTSSNPIGGTDQLTIADLRLSIDKMCSAVVSRM